MSTATIEPQKLHEKCTRGECVRIIDVRGPAGTAQMHASGAASVPLNLLDASALAGEQKASGNPIYLLCQSGMRAAQAQQRLAAAGCDNAVVIAGGTRAWHDAGLPMVHSGGGRISIERQVRIGAGLIVLIGVALGWLIHPAFFALSAFVGAGLLFAGITDTCGMALVLLKMPWNR